MSSFCHLQWKSRAHVKTVLLVHTEPRDVSRPWEFSSLSCSPHPHFLSAAYPASFHPHTQLPAPVPEVRHHRCSLKHISKKQAKSKRKKKLMRLSQVAFQSSSCSVSLRRETLQETGHSSPVFLSPALPILCSSPRLHGTDPVTTRLHVAQPRGLLLPGPGPVLDPSANSAFPEPGFFSLCSHPAVSLLYCTALTFPLDRAMLL